MWRSVGAGVRRSVGAGDFVGAGVGNSGGVVGAEKEKVVPRKLEPKWQRMSIHMIV